MKKFLILVLVIASSLVTVSSQIAEEAKGQEQSEARPLSRRGHFSS